MSLYAIKHAHIKIKIVMARIKFCPGMKASYFVNLNLFCAVFKDIYYAGSFVANFSILFFAKYDDG